MRCAVVDKPAMRWTWISRSRPSWPEWRPRISASGRLPPIPPNSCDSCQCMEAARIEVANTDRLRAIIAEHRWPGRVLVGDEGAEAAWLIAQHADRQLDFQREALALLERAVHDGDAPASHLAYLTDRVRMNEGRPQLFGTQVADITNRVASPWPIEDEEHVDQRRANAGLESLADYLNNFTSASPYAEPLAGWLSGA
jgi:Family of unknown function (DUF6624)